MSELADAERPDGRRRADARRSIAAILDAAVGLLAERPDASMADLAAAAGVTRQTVYAHFRSREALLEAVSARALEQTLTALDGAAPQDGPPAEALDRLVVAWWANVARHARVLETLASAHPTAEAVHALHLPVLDRLGRLIRRGQRSGAFDRRLPPAWLASAFLGLMHASADEVAAGRVTADEAGAALRRAVPRLFGAA
jgi:AcrR family transcriptional regulator